MEEFQVGRVLSVSGFSGYAEFIPKVRVGDFIYYKAGERKVICQITSLASAPFKGIHGYFKILDAAVELPRSWVDLYLLEPFGDVGHIYVGNGLKGEKVNLRVNPFFRHVLIAGITQKGKTHLQIAMQEEFLRHRIPSLVIDSQGEFVHLNEFSENAIVSEDIKFEDMIAYLKHRKTVIYNLQGLSYRVKATRTYEILSGLVEAKERDYKAAENDIRLLEIPPVIVDIDEAEIYAPELYTSILDPECKEVIVDIAKRGSKYGVGLIVASQRPPQLNVDVRSQCNSAVMFHINDVGSRKVLGNLPYITRFELNRVKNLLRGQCIITGELVDYPILVYVREIETRRAKKTDFEEMLGLDKQKKTIVEKVEANCDVSLVTTQEGEIVDTTNGQIVGIVEQNPMPLSDDNQPSKTRTRQWGSPEPLGTSDEENRKIINQLRRIRKEERRLEVERG